MCFHAFISIEVFQVYNNNEIDNSIQKLIIDISSKSLNKLSKLSPNITFNDKSEISFVSSAYIGFANNSDTIELNKLLIGNELFTDNSKTLWLPGFHESSKMSNLILIKNNKSLSFNRSDLKFIKLNPRNSGLKKMMGMTQNPTSFSLEISLNDGALKTIQSNLLSNNQNNSTLIFVCKIGNSVLHTELLLPNDKLDEVQFMSPVDINTKNQIETDFPDLYKK